MPTVPNILIVDNGSQYTRVISRSLRESSYRTVVLPPTKAAIWLAKNKPKGIILSGSNKSVYDADAPQAPSAIFKARVPILCICYGTQWVVDHFGGSVGRTPGHAEYGPATAYLEQDSRLFKGLKRKQIVWASHGDSIANLPPHTDVHATNKDGDVVAIHIPKHKIWGVLFHPEVSHTPCGKQILTNFVHDICGCEPDWEPVDLAKDIGSELSADPTIRAVLGFSGGVDSTTIAAVLAPVLGKRLLGVCIDGGQLREAELEEIRRHAAAAGIRLRVIKARGQFLKALRGITDAEKKRKAFKKVYRRLLMQVAKAFGATHIVQGTLATDLIESGATGGHVIKSHHNVGHNWGKLGVLEPFSSLFKYEVRALAQAIGLPKSVVNREPFPGPGLFIRIIGAITKERLDVVRWADHEVRKITNNASRMPEVSQMPIGLDCNNVVGVKGDARVYGPTVVIHPIKTVDYMTAEAPVLPTRVMEAVTAAVTKHPDIVGVWWDYTPKPSRTTEFE